jgi:hypothetical protein
LAVQWLGVARVGAPGVRNKPDSLGRHDQIQRGNGKRAKHAPARATGLHALPRLLGGVKQ